MIVIGSLSNGVQFPIQGIKLLRYYVPQYPLLIASEPPSGRPSRYERRNRVAEYCKICNWNHL